MNLPHHSVGFRFSSDLSLLTLKGVGFHAIDTHQYFWDSRIRKNEHCLFQYTVKGKGVLESDGILYNLNPGDGFLIDIPGESRYYLPEDSSFWEVLYLEFSKDCLPLLHKIHRLCGPVLSFSPDDPLVSVMFEIYEQALTNGLHTYFENAKTAYNFFLDLTAFATEQSCEEPKQIDLAKAYIDRHYVSSQLNLDEIAAYAGISKYYMSKEFRKKFGTSPGKYLNHLRIQQACRLLLQNQTHSLNEIAQMSGFSNNNYFGKVFKKAKGITPHQYRSQNGHYDFVRIIHEKPKMPSLKKTSYAASEKSQADI